MVELGIVDASSLSPDTPATLQKRSRCFCVPSEARNTGCVVKSIRHTTHSHCSASPLRGPLKRSKFGYWPICRMGMPPCDVRLCNIPSGCHKAKRPFFRVGLASVGALISLAEFGIVQLEGSQIVGFLKSHPLRRAQGIQTGQRQQFGVVYFGLRCTTLRRVNR